MRINDEHFQKWSFIDVKMMITKVWSLPGLATVAGLSLLLALVVVTFHQVQSQPRHRGEAETEKGVSCHSLITSEEWGVRSEMLCPGSPYPRSRVPASPSLSLRSARSARSGGSWSQGSRASAGSVRSRVITYKSETTTSQGIFGKKKRDAFECQFERLDWVQLSINHRQFN